MSPIWTLTACGRCSDPSSRIKIRCSPRCWECLPKAVLEPFMGIALAEKNCPIKGHTFFLGQLTFTMTDRQKDMKARPAAPAWEDHPSSRRPCWTPRACTRTPLQLASPSAQFCFLSLPPFHRCCSRELSLIKALHASLCFRVCSPRDLFNSDVCKVALCYFSRYTLAYSKKDSV